MKLPNATRLFSTCLILVVLLIGNAAIGQIWTEDFEVDEFYRFEGMSSTDDNSILYAISSKNGIKGLLVDAYGVYSENLNEKMIQKLKMKH